MSDLAGAVEFISGQLEEGSFVWIVLFGTVFILTFIQFFRGIYIYKKRSVESSNFVALCVPVIIWAFLLVCGPVFGLDNSEGTWTYFGITSVGLLVPALLLLHIWRQVSYRPITAAVRLLWLAAPVFLISVEALEAFSPEHNIKEMFDSQISLLALITIAYYIVAIVRSYLLCFNVFYQMPKHMRRSTYQLLISITALAVTHGFPAFYPVPDNIYKVMLAVVYIIVLCTLYTAFFIANSSNVIVTSRDFVFSSLSTLVITVSLKGNILDWNHKKKGGCHPLPDPKYKEPYPLYQKRILEMCNGTISPHDENILNIKGEKGENYFLFTWHDIAYQGRKFGYLVEIFEITKSYSKFRYIEEIAYYDNLTSLHNRNAYIERVKQISQPENMPLLIAVGDVNNLKKINDTLGHLYGDRLLIYVAEAVKDNAPEGAFVARIGGDELVMLMAGADEGAGESFVAAVNETLNSIVDPDIGTPSISWGYSVMYDVRENYNDVFRAADAIMYESKRKAREISLSGFVPQ